MATSSDVPACICKKEGKVALITGGGERHRRAHGAAVRAVVKHGASVVIADIHDELGEGASSYVRCDVTSEDDVAGAVDHTVASFGKLDIIFNNAGIGGAACNSIRESTKADFERVLAVVSPEK